jgi:hypothetical protein
MMDMLRKLWRDDGGAVVSMEIVVVATVLVIALLAAWAVVRNAVFTQINDQAEWIAGSEQTQQSQTQSLQSVEGVEGTETPEDIVTVAERFGQTKP